MNWWSGVWGVVAYRFLVSAPVPLGLIGVELGWTGLGLGLGSLGTVLDKNRPQLFKLIIVMLCRYFTSGPLQRLT